MYTINLNNGFYVEVDDICFTLKRKFKPEGKKAKNEEAVKIYGYYSKSDWKGMLKGYLWHAQNAILDGEKIEVSEAVQKIQDCNDKSADSMFEIIRKEVYGC